MQFVLQFINFCFIGKFYSLPEKTRFYVIFYMFLMIRLPPVLFTQPKWDYLSFQYTLLFPTPIFCSKKRNNCQLKIQVHVLLVTRAKEQNCSKKREKMIVSLNAVKKITSS